MSDVTDVIVLLNLANPDREAEFMAHAAAFEWDGRTGSLARMSTDETGGGMVFLSTVLAGAFNYFPADEYIAHLRTFPWDDEAGVSASLIAQPEQGWTVAEVLHQAAWI